VQIPALKRKRIIDKQRDALLRHGHSPTALYWSSREIQELRFQVLLEIGVKTVASVLDVGCGFGDLYDYLQRRGIETDYTGIDLSPELIDKARELYPSAEFHSGDIFEFDPPAQSYDYVLLSGALNEEMDDGGDYARQVIRRMYQTCRKGLAFNLLDARDSSVAGRFDLQCFQPEEILNYCRSLGGECSLRDDYLDNDFTLLIIR
jgi:SAM-dependent methyltransferase